MSGRPVAKMITFPGATGVELAARLDLPDGAPRAYALFAHCFTCSKDSLAATRIGRELTGRGFAVLRFDFTGLGGSTGDFANTDFSSNIADLVAAAHWLRTEHRAPSVLIGHSLGGAAVLAAAAQMPEAVAVVTIGAPFEPAHIKHLLAPALPALAEHGEAEIDLAGRRFRIRRQLLDDLDRSNNTDSIGHLRKALLVMHSPRDSTVNIDNARQIYDTAKHPKSFVSLDDADHLLTRKIDAQYVAEVLGAWASRYLPEHESARAPEPGIGGADTEVVAGVRVAGVPGAPFAQSIAVGRHRLCADEPVAVG
ncbi:MAG: alpha/beta hydrolase, partial [Proteobacteria bacterium]|nr:alpha/beta hydrolase [Burkholderiales bacterium]